MAGGAHVSYTPDQIAALYQFPPALSGNDPSIAIIELGGGFDDADIESYFKAVQLPKPNIEVISVLGGENSPDQDENADIEVTLDIVVAAAAYSYAAKKAANLKVFFAPDAGLPDAVAAAAAHASKPCACSISWGAPENRWSKGDRDAMEKALSAAAQVQMTVLAAAGDNGSGDGEAGHHVDYPASSPQVLACGGTSLHATNEAIHSERVWNDGSQGGATGGGFSAHFQRPAWQASKFGNAMRGVPDLSGDADPYTGYVITVDGSQQVIGGTSAVAPLMAALVAVLCKSKGKRLGMIHPQLYAHAAAFRDIKLGNNGAFSAASGWDATTGLGVPVGAKVLLSV
jgi:kumamolisin